MRFCFNFGFVLKIIKKEVFMKFKIIGIIIAVIIIVVLILRAC